MERRRTMGILLAFALLCAHAHAHAIGAARSSRVRSPVLQRRAARASSQPARAAAVDVADAEPRADASSPRADASSPLFYDWRAQWYAVCFEENLPEGAEPLAFSAFGHALVLWRDGSGTLRAVADRCPHRLAKLSEGRVRNGDLECQYHGWAFEGSAGACVSIPQLADGAAIPARACVPPHAVAVREGIVFVWLTPGETELSRLPPPPASEDDLDADRSFSVYSFQIDLPYESSFLVENLLDPAHIPVSHDRTPGGGKRENAQPLEMEVPAEGVSAAGFKGRYRNTRARAGGAPPGWIDVRFAAPGIIYQRSVGGPLQFGAALHCMPLAAGRSRLLFRTYFKGLPLAARLLLGLKPLWLRHLNSCKILEQDAGLIATQEDALAAPGAQGASLGRQYLPLRSADVFVVAYRKWLDRVSPAQGVGMPWAVGWDAPAAAALRLASPLAVAGGTLAPSLAAAHRSGAEDRYSRHVRHCRATRTALARVRALKRCLLALGGAGALLAAALTPATGSLAAALGAALALGAGLAARRVERMFFEPFVRREELRLRERPV